MIGFPNIGATLFTLVIDGAWNLEERGEIFAVVFVATFPTLGNALLVVVAVPPKLNIVFDFPKPSKFPKPLVAVVVFTGDENMGRAEVVLLAEVTLDVPKLKPVELVVVEFTEDEKVGRAEIVLLAEGMLVVPKLKPVVVVPKLVVIVGDEKLGRAEVVLLVEMTLGVKLKPVELVPEVVVATLVKDSDKAKLGVVGLFPKANRDLGG